MSLENISSTSRGSIYYYDHIIFTCYNLYVQMLVYIPIVQLGCAAFIDII